MTQTKFRTKITLIALAALGLALVWGLSVIKIQAGSGDNLSGWTWSETIGWINFNGANYGVNVDSNGNISGYAWSEHIGWISFNDFSGCPSSPCSPKLDRGTGQVSGWARAYRAVATEGQTLGGWDGWIHLRGSNYGVSVSGCSWDGWAWGSDVVGWVHFRGSNYGVNGSGNACQGEPTLVIVPPSASLQVGQTTLLQALYDPDGPSGPSGESNVTASSNWSSSASGIASVNNSTQKGLVSANAVGSAVITAAYSGLSATSDITVGAAPLPNLRILSSSFAPASPVPGSLMNFYADVSNNGSGSAGPSQTRLRIDIGNNGTWDVLPANAATAGLAPGAAVGVNWSGVWTATSGTHKYEICSDATSLISEENETDNCVTQTFTISVLAQPDYVTEGLATAPGGLTAGQLVTFAATVRNSGSGAAAVSSQTRLRLDISNNGSFDVTPANQTTNALAPGATEVENWTNAWTAQVGTHRFEVCADSSSVITESNESNNCTTQTFTVGAAPLPNLTITSFSVPNGTPGASGNASVTIQNAGSAATPAGFEVGFHDGSPSIASISCSNEETGVATAALGAGASRTLTIPFTYPSAGTHTARAMVDSDCAISESNETDNAASANYNVSVLAQPDYVTEGLATAPGGLTAGQLVTFAATVRNSGSGAAAVSSQTRLRLDISNNGSFDVTPANQTTNALAPGATEVENWTNAWTAQVGTHRFEICADSSSVITESNESNNCATQTFTVAPLILPPDFSLSADPNSIFATITGSSPVTSSKSVIRVTAFNDFDSSVSLSSNAASVIPGATGNFSDSTLSSAEYSTGSEFSVTVPASASPVLYNITVQGTGGGLPPRSVNVALNVKLRDPDFIEVLRPFLGPWAQIETHISFPRASL